MEAVAQQVQLGRLAERGLAGLVAVAVGLAVTQCLSIAAAVAAGLADMPEMVVQGAMPALLVRLGLVVVVVVAAAELTPGYRAELAEVVVASG